MKPQSQLEANELGDFLRSRRERLNPERLGFSSARRRRTPGLRREEVAELAGIGVDWYIRLEQGRSVSPSAGTIDSLASALKLSAEEHRHLRALTSSKVREKYQRETVPPTLQRLINRLEQPAYITGRRWDVLAWNNAAAEIFSDFRLSREEDRNIMIYVFLSAQARKMFGAGWAAEAKRILAQFRTTYDLWAYDPAFQELLQRLKNGSREFATWWEAHDIKSTHSGQKTLHHPKKGMQKFEYASFQANDNSALKLVIYSLA